KSALLGGICPYSTLGVRRSGLGVLRSLSPCALNLERSTLNDQWSKLPQQTLNQLSGHINAGIAADLAHAGGAGDVDFGEVVADDVQANKVQPFFFQNRADFFSDGAVFITEWLGYAAAAGGQVATGFAAGRNARQAVGHGFAVNHQNALVALHNVRNKTLRHDLLLTMVGEGFDNDADVWVVLFQAKNRRAAHAVQRFENHIAVLFMEGFQQVGPAGNDGGRHQLREGGGKDFFVTIAQALRLVGDQ